MEKIIGLNLKMNLDYQEATEYVTKVKGKLGKKHEIIFFPSYLYLDLFKQTGYKVGAQNSSPIDRGSYTGEVSPLQLKSSGVNYVILGHSERRTKFQEDDKLINFKIRGCLKNKLKIILCIGETDIDRRMNRTALSLEHQLIMALNNIKEADYKNIVIAYEPYWAIGSGITPTCSDIEEVIRYIDKTCLKELSIKLPVLYGGSVKKENIQDILNVPEIGGVLVGTSCIDYKYLIEMMKLINV